MSAASDREFVLQDAAAQRGTFVRHVHVDMTGDYHSAAMLSQILYWNLPDRGGETKLRVRKEGRLWLVKRFEDWREECRLSPDQARRALANLKNLGIVDVRVFRFNGSPTSHVRLRFSPYAALLREASAALAAPDGTGESPISVLADSPDRPGGKPISLTGDYKQETTNKNMADAEDGVPPRAGTNGKANGQSPPRTNGLVPPPKKSRFAVPVKNHKPSEFDFKAGKKIKRMLTDAGAVLGPRTKAETFADSVRRLRERGGVSESKIRGVVDWLALHYGEPYVPRLHAGDDLFEKWDSFTAACHKETTGNLTGEDLEAQIQQEAWSRYREAFPDDGFNYDYVKMNKFRREVRRELTGTAAE